MALKRIKDFPDGSGSLTSDDVFIFMDDPSGTSVTKKISLSQINSAIGGGGGGTSNVTISNSGLNRVLVSDGSTSGIVGQANLTFSQSLLSVSGNFIATSGLFTQRLDAPLSHHTVSPAISGIVNDWNPGSVADIIRASGHFNARINGLISTYGSDAVLLYNVGDANTITLTHSSGTNSNRFLVPWGGDYIIDPSGGAALIVRDKVSDRWRIT